MKRILLVILILVVISVPTANIFSADYFLFDRENNKILYMGANDTQFTEKIDMEKNPDRLMPTNDPDKYLAIFAPEVKKGKEKDAQKGQIIVYNIATGRTEDLVDMGYSPFNWTYTKDHRHIFITYRPTLTSKYYELLHYNIADKTTEKIPEFATKLNDLALSFDETKLFALIPGENVKTPGKVEVLSYEPLEVKTTIETDVNPRELFVLSPEKFVLIDADEKNHKKPGDIKIYNFSDYSISDDFKFGPSYEIFNGWYSDQHTLISMIRTTQYKSFACKITNDGIKTTEVPFGWLEARYYKDKEKDNLFLFTRNQFLMMDYSRDKLLACPIDINSTKYSYQMNYIPDTNMVILFSEQGGKVKFIDLSFSEPRMVKSSDCGRNSAKFGNFMANFVVSAALTRLSFDMMDYGLFRIYTVNMFQPGTFVGAAPDNSKYYILRRDTRDITVFLTTFDKPTYIVPRESPLTMYQIKKPAPQSLVISSNRVYLVNPEDDSLKEIYVFKEPISDCIFFEEENRLIILTDRSLLVIDKSSLEVKNDYLFYGNPDEKYTHLKKGEQRYYFIPSL